MYQVNKNIATGTTSAIVTNSITKEILHSETHSINSGANLLVGAVFLRLSTSLTSQKQVIVIASADT